MLNRPNRDILKTLAYIPPDGPVHQWTWGTDPINDGALRLGALYGFKIPDTDFEGELDEITRW